MENGVRLLQTIEPLMTKKVISDDISLSLHSCECKQAHMSMHSVRLRQPGVNTLHYIILHEPSVA